MRVCEGSEPSVVVSPRDPVTLTQQVRPVDRHERAEVLLPVEVLVTNLLQHQAAGLVVPHISLLQIFEAQAHIFSGLFILVREAKVENLCGQTVWFSPVQCSDGVSPKQDCFICPSKEVRGADQHLGGVQPTGEHHRVHWLADGHLLQDNVLLGVPLYTLSVSEPVPLQEGY